MAGSRRSAPWGSARARLVDAAREILVEEFSSERPRAEAVASAFSFLDPAKVAQRAGVARSAFYHHWPDSEDASDALSPFQRFLAEVFETDWGDPYSSDVIGIAAVHSGPFPDFVRKATDAEWQRYEAPEQWASYRALTAIAAFGGSDRSTLEFLTDSLAMLYEGLLERFSMQMRSPLTTTDLAVSVMAVLEGFWVRRLCGEEYPNRSVMWTDPETGAPDEWTLVSLCAMAIVEAMTEPVSS